MMRAAAGGVVDFSKSRRDSFKWKIYLELMLQQLQVNEMCRLEALDCLRQASQAPAMPSYEGKKLCSDKAFQARQNIISLLLDGRSYDEKGRLRQEAKTAMSSWESHFGGLDDQKTQADLDLLVEWLQQQRVDT